MASMPNETARWVLPTPGGPRNTAFSWRSRKRRLASSRIFFSSIEAGNLKSNCSSRLRSGKPASCVRTLIFRSWRTLASLLRQALIVSRVADHGAMPFGQPMLSDHFDIVVDLDASAGYRLPHQQGLAGEAKRDRITVAAIAQHAVFGHTPIFHVTGVVIGLLVNQQQPFLGPSLVGRLARGGVLPVVDLFH